MEYLLYLIAFNLFLFGLITLIKPLKANRIINVLAYIIPFWMWGFILISLSIFFWLFKENFSNLIFLILSLLFLIKGLFLIFSPKRKIKKIIENWKKLPSEVKRIESFIYIAVSILIITTII